MALRNPIRIARRADPIRRGAAVVWQFGHLAFGFPDKLEGGLVSVLSRSRSLAPVALLLVDALVGRGATIEYLGIKLALGSGANIPASVAVPTNIGVPAQPVSDSSTGQILDALRVAVSKEVVIVDLESGRAWWETRLLVLVARAERQRATPRIVFLATAGTARPDAFRAGDRPADLLPALLDANLKYQLCYARAKAAAAQWALVDTTETPAPPPIQPWMSRLATQHPSMEFDPGSGLPNPFAFEQFFANELGKNEVEMVTEVVVLYRRWRNCSAGSRSRSASEDDCGERTKRLPRLSAGCRALLSRLRGAGYTSDCSRRTPESPHLCNLSRSQLQRVDVRA